jgi:hypothetical protein
MTMSNRLIFTNPPPPRFLLLKTLAAGIGLYLLLVFVLGVGHG